MTGIEPACRKALDPDSSASANSATSAYVNQIYVTNVNRWYLNLINGKCFITLIILSFNYIFVNEI